MVKDEASLVSRRINSVISTEAILIQMAVSSVISAEGGKQFAKLIEGLSEE